MTLFSSDDIEGSKAPIDTYILTAKNPILKIGSGEAAEVARLALANEAMLYLSTGRLSLHQMLECLLELTGPAHVALSAWAITEDPARCLFRLRRNETIKQLSCVVSDRMPVQNAGAYQLLMNVADDIALVKNHAKTISIVNDSFAIGLVSTANLSNNPRHEMTQIYNQRAVAEWIRDWIIGLCQKQQHEQR